MSQLSIYSFRSTLCKLISCNKSNNYVFQLQVKKTKNVFRLRLFRFNINCNRVLFFICTDNISKSDQVLCVLPSKWLRADEVAKICIAKSKHTCFSLYLYIFCLLFLPALVLFFSLLNLIILRSQFLLVRVCESHLWYTHSLLLLFLFQEHSSS